MLSSAKPNHQEIGFTLIELLIVIIVIAILIASALPRFIDIRQDAQIGIIKATGEAFNSGINIAQVKLATLGRTAPASNVPIYSTEGEGQLDFNLWGWPAQNWPLEEESPRTNNVADCISLWVTILEEGSTVSSSSSLNDSEYQAIYINPDQCQYRYNARPTLSIFYDSRNGDVSTNIS